MSGKSLCVMCLVISLSAVVALCGELEVSIIPVKKAYCLGEPIAVTVHLKNGTSKDARILSRYPYANGITVTGKQLNGEECAKATDLQDVGRRKFSLLIAPYVPPPTITLEAGSEFQGTIYISKYCVFNKADTYTMKWIGKHFLGPEGHWIESVCTFAITVVAGEFREKDLGPILDQWRGDDDTIASEVIAGLSCVRQDFVCKYLVKYGREMPSVGGQVVAALKKFAETEEGKKSLEAMGAVFPKDETTISHGVRASKEGCWGSIVQSWVLDVFAEIGTLPSEKFVLEQLASTSERRKWGVLKFLEHHGLAGKLPLDALEPLLHDESKELAKEAKKVMDKFAKKEPTKDKEGQ